MSLMCTWLSLSLFRYTIDIIILTALIQGITLLSNYFWLLWLLVGTQHGTKYDILLHYLPLAPGTIVHLLQAMGDSPLAVVHLWGP